MDSAPATAGELRDRVTLKEILGGQIDSLGHETRERVVASRIPCKVRALGGQELIIAEQIHAGSRYEVILRASPGAKLRQDQWFEWTDVYGTHKLTIGFVENIDQLNSWWRVLCGESEEDFQPNG